jgi:hypothetical protein
MAVLPSGVIATHAATTAMSAFKTVACIMANRISQQNKKRGKCRLWVFAGEGGEELGRRGKRRYFYRGIS